MMNSQVKATQASHISEDFDSLLKKLSTKSEQLSEVSKTEQIPIREVGIANVFKQKDDVIYITDPNPEWQFWSPLRVGGEKGPLSIAISLQKDQTIALLLRKYNAVGNTVHSH